jgi:DNA-binding transcriptional LysR family regulator
MDLIALRLFDHIADTGSFTAAATHYRLAVSTVSRQIGALEEELGQRLFFRHTRAVSLTESGRLFHEQVRDILHRLDQATETLASHGKSPSGVLHINAPVSFGRRHVVPLLRDFQAHYPAVRVDLTLSDAYGDPVQSGTDITFRIGSLPDSNLVARELASLRYVVCATPRYLAERRAPASPGNLVEHNCLVYRGTRGLQYWYFRSAHERDWQEIEVEGDLYCNDADALLVAGLQHRGLMLFPTWLVYEELAQGHLQQVLGGWQASIEPAQTSIHLVLPGSRLRSPKVSLFIEYLRERMGDAPYWDDDHSVTST